MGSEQLALLIIGLILGGFEQIRLVDWVKAKLGVEGLQAKLVAAIIAVGVSLVALFVSGEVGLADFNMNNLPIVFSAVYGLSELLYFRRKVNGS